MVDLGKLFDKVGLDSVGDTVGWVVDNKGALGKAVDFVRDLDDKIPELIKTLPGMLASLGGGLAEAGEQAQRAAVTLLGADGGGGAKELLDRGSGALTAMTSQLSGAAAAITEVADDVAKVGIPSFEAKYTEVVGFRVISGVEMETNPILKGPATKLKSGADTVTEVTGNIAELADDLAKLAGVMAAIGGALDGLGERLGSSGNQIRGLMGAPDASPPKGPSAFKGKGALEKSKPAAAKPAPAKKPALKKAD